MTAGWRARVDRFWAAELDVDVTAFAHPGVHVLERDGDDSDPRLVVVGTPTATVISITRDDRQRFAEAVLAAAIGRALADSRVPQYRVHDQNAVSRALATRMKFEEYGWMATIRLRP